MEFAEQLEQKRLLCENVIQQYLPSQASIQKTVTDAMNYSVLGGGKRIRPILMNETYHMFGGKSDVIKPFMAAMEMIHTYSLVHDDLPAMDNDEYRRGRKTTHIVYGEAMGILAGDGLLNYAFETAVKAFDVPGTGNEVAGALKYFSGKTGIYGMIGGQVGDIEAEEKKVEISQLVTIYEMKTAALLQAAMVTGAILAGATFGEQKILEEAARCMGIAFQIQDDILDVTSSLEELGKKTGSDEKNHKETYVTLTSLDEAEKMVESLSNDAIKCLDKLVVKNAFLKELILALIHRAK